MRIRFSLSSTTDRISKSGVAAALGVGVVKMNMDAAWPHWEGIRNFYKANEGYFQGWKTLRVRTRPKRKASRKD